MHLMLIFVLFFVSNVFEIEGFGIPNVTRMHLNEKVSKVHLIFMNHLDVGYSDTGQIGYSANVLNTYFNDFYPRAISLSRQMRSEGYVEQFRYTTHAWLLHMFIHCPPHLVLANIRVKCPSPSDLKSMIQAIKDKDIIWHDGPMNMNYETLNAFGLNVALNISSNLNKEFGIDKPLRVISIRDVPGLTRGVIRVLLESGVVGISSGVNSGSAPPAVPPFSRWRAAPRSFGERNIPEILFMQNPNGYPDYPGNNPNNPGGLSEDNCHLAPGSTEVLCFMFRGDNAGPPKSVQEVLLSYEIVRARYVNAKLIASTFEDFFAIAWKNKETLPVVDLELGDTWIQGTASDPKKFARFRAMQRQFEYYYKSGQPITDVVFNASRFLIKPGEHTYGLDGCKDSVNWRNDQFLKVRKNGCMQAEELSWVEQRQYEKLVLETLGLDHPLTAVILREFKIMERVDIFPERQYDLVYTNFNSESEAGSYNFTCSHNEDSIVIGFRDGAISFLLAENIEITQQNPLGKLIYRTYNESDTEFFLKYYQTNWNAGYGKPNSTIHAHPESKDWEMTLRSIYRQRDTPCSFLVIVSPMNSTASTYYGCPEEVFVKWDVDISNDEIATEVFWDRKHPTRLMEAISFSFKPLFSENIYQWYFSKMGEPISPYSVILNGSQWQHNVDDSGVFVALAPDADPIFRVVPWDTGITCPITASYGPTVWPAPLFPITEHVTGFAFNIYNNVWNTNYINWYPFHGEDTYNDKFFKARFTTHLKLIKTKVEGGVLI